MSGSVTFDKATGITSAITMHVTQGKALGGVTGLPANTYILALPVSANWIAATTHPVMVGN
ncbi:hypothetical protein [Brevundimonas diminuta]|uniref:hypothetical protein n=1 Tax=Brevundimonas diminuta TaxID=293 RepID=UPI003D01616A